jgi:AcrR family transcriptional regulator
VALADPVDQRARILDAALHLMAAGGVHAMGMRRLANELGLNVATLYHYFPSKGDLLRAVVAQQDYATLLRQTPPVERSRSDAERLAALLRWIWTEMGTQEDMWRLLLGESLRGDTDVMDSAAELSALFEEALADWLADFVPGLPGEPVAAARLLRGAIYGFFIEYLPLPRRDRDILLATRADEIAGVLAG